ncbi:hypothetical protein, partial [Halomonas sp. 3A7M]
VDRESIGASFTDSGRYIDANVDHAGLALANMKLSERMDDISNLALVNKKSRSRGMKSVAAFVGIDSEGETSFESVRNNLKNKKDKKLRFFEGEMLDEKN